MKNFKRGIALMLAVVMVIATCLLHAEGALWATNGIETGEITDLTNDATITEETNGEDAAISEQEEIQSQPQEPVQEVEEIEIPAKDVEKEEVPVQGAEQEEISAQDTEKEENSVEKAEKMIPVTFTTSTVNGGILYVWAEGQEKEKASYDKFKYVKEVKEGSRLYFEIETSQNYEIDQVKDKEGNVYKPESVNENISTYKMIVSAEQQITIEYKEVSVEKEQKKEESKTSKVVSKKANIEYKETFNIKEGEKLTIEGATGSEHEWLTWDYTVYENTEDENKQNYVGRGLKAGETTVRHRYKVADERQEEYFNIIVRPTDTYDLYYYTLLPGKDLNAQGKPDQKWNGMGVGLITGVKPPSEYGKGTIVSEGTAVYPTKPFPDIQAEDKIYHYAEEDSENAFKEGYYTIEWIRTVVSTGANVGNNHYNPQVPNNKLTFHKDGMIRLNEKEWYTVTFKIKEPKANGFTIQDKYSRRVRDGFAESDLSKPDGTDRIIDGKHYSFDGWYLDESCTQKADFSGTITKNTDYYGKYYLNEDTLHYDGNGANGGSTKDTIGKLHGTVEVGENGFTREGYTFTGWNTKADGSGKAYKKGDSYQLTDEEDILYAQWEAKEAFIQYEENGGTDVQDLSGKTDEKITNRELPVTTRQEYIFEGWYENESFTGDAITSLPEVYPPGITTYYAKWSRDTSKFKALPYEGKYDGKAHTISFDTSVLEKDKETLVYRTPGTKKWQTEQITYTDVTNGTVVVEVGVLDNTGKEVWVGSSAVTIIPREVTLTSATDSKMYDGTELINHEVTVSGDGFVEKENVICNVTGTQIKPGKSDNEFTYKEDSNTKLKNYSITKEEGTLTVTDRPDAEKYVVTVTPNSKKEKYDKTQKTVSGFVGELGNKIPVKAENGITYYVTGLTAESVGTDAGTYPVKVEGTAVVTDADGANLTNQFQIKVEKAALVVEKRNVTITSATASKQYDGTALTNSEVKVTGDGWATGEEPTYEVSGTQTLVGSSKNSFEYKFTDGINAKNYSVTKEEGTLTITDRADAEKYEIIVEANSNTGNVYDGTKKTAEGLKQTTFVVDGQTYTVEGLYAKITKKNAGTYDVPIKGKGIVRDEAGNDVTKQFNVKKVKGQLTIAKKAVTVTADSKTREYGTLNPKFTYTVKGIVAGEKLEDVTTVPKMTTTAINNSPKGEYPITFAEAVSESDNYKIEYVNGTLTVRQKDVILTIKAVNDTKVYNGSALKNNKVSVKENTLAKGDYIANVIMTDDSSITNVGEQGNVISKVVIKNSEGVDVTESYAGINFEAGKLTVTPAIIEVTADNKGKVIGQADPELTYAVSKDSKVDGEKAAFEGTVEREPGEKVGNYHILEGTLKLINNGAFLAGNYKLKVKPGIFKIEKPDYTVIKERTNEGTGENGTFKAGETATFDITVQNNSKNYGVENVVVEDVLHNGDGNVTILPSADHSYTVNGTKAIVAKLDAGQSITIKATYVVTQSDLDNQTEITNTALVQTDGVTPEESKPVEIPIEADHPEIQSEKTLTNKGTGEAGSFKIGETATFDITVKNTGNVMLSNVTVKEELEGAKVVPRTGYIVNENKIAVIERLNVGETIVVKAEYQVTQADIDNGGTVNVVVVEGRGPGKTDPEPNKPKEEIPTDDKKPEAIVAKRLTNEGTGEGGSFKAGETAAFDITVENIGNVTLRDVVVKEQLTGAKIVKGEGYSVSEDGSLATIAAVGAGKTATVKAEYVVTQEDVNNGGAKNIAAIEIPGKEDPQNPSEEIPTELHKPEIESSKTLTNQGTGKNGSFKVGETAEFDIVVKNTGNVTLKDVTVKEQLAGAKIIESNGYTINIDSTEAMIDTLEVGQIVVIKAIYTVTQKDVDNGGTINSVIANGNGPGEKNPESSEAETIISTEEPESSMGINKKVISQPREDGEYRIGDTIAYAIEVINSGNVTLHNIVVKDMLNVSGQVTWEDGILTNGNNEAIIKSMEPGETIVLNCSYVVTRADVGSDIVNGAVADSDETTPTDPSITTPVKVESYYNLTINYVYSDGSTAAPSVIAQYLKGETFGYTSPTITGYTPDYAFVRSDANGMPARDYTFTVVYTADLMPVVRGVDHDNTQIEEPVGAELRADTNGDVEVQEVVEADVPLANRDLDDHDCCIMHFLLMLAAMIVYAFYTRSMKKRQKRVAELTDELEIELLKREQGAEEQE